MGNFETGNGLISNSYWKDIEVEDTACGMFTKKDGRTSTIFCSWRLLSGYFFFELNGSKGYINVDGRFDTHGGDKIFWSINNDKKFYDFEDLESLYGIMYEDASVYEDSMFSFISETSFLEDEFYISEKVVKALGQNHPFIVFGNFFLFSSSKLHLFPFGVPFLFISKFILVLTIL